MEYINGVNQFGNIIVDSDRVSTDSDTPSGGGGGILIVNAEAQYDYQTGGYVVNSVDKNFSEIYNHTADGGVAVANVLVKSPGAPYDTVYSIPLAMRATNGSSVEGTIFTATNSNQSPSLIFSLYALDIVFDEDNSVSFKLLSRDFRTT